LKYLLDSNVLISLLRQRHAAPILARLDGLADDDAVVCSVVRVELIAGALKSQRPDQNLAAVEEILSDFDSLPLDDAAANRAGRVRAALEGAGTMIGPNDLLIAGIALANNLTLVTNNRGEFSRVTGLRLDNWESPG
jgi:tRNA(fMet)-specific endonuclease VapC